MFTSGATRRVRCGPRARSLSRGAGIEFVASYADIGGGFGGYNEDHEFFGYRQSL